MTRARPRSKWSMDGHVHALARDPAGGNCSGMICACMSTIIDSSVPSPRVTGGGHSGWSGARSPRSSIKSQNRTRDLAGLHRAERLVDVVEPPAARDHLVEHEPALAVELQVARNVGPEAIAAHARGLHLALRANGHPRELDLRVRRHDTDDRRRATDREALD